MMKTGRYLLICVGTLFTISCMPKIDDDLGIAQLLVTNHSITKLSSTEANIVLEGTYPADVTKIYLSVDGGAFKELSATSPIASVTLNNGRFTITYQVPNSQTARTIKFQIRGGNSEGRQGEIATYDIAYHKPASAMPGFAIVSAGGLIHMGSDYVLNSVGQPVSPTMPSTGVLVSGTNGAVRYGVIGILLEP